MNRSKWRTYSHLPRFYMDRTVRLFPSLFCVVVFGYYSVGHTLPNFGGKQNILVAIRALFSLQNTPFLQVESRNPFEFTWSLACEEQFYLVWSLFLPLIAPRTNRTKIWIMVSLILASFFSRQYAGMGYPTYWFQSWNRGFMSNIYKMLFGSSFRLLPFPRYLTQRKYSYYGISLIPVTLIWTYLYNENPWKMTTLASDLIASAAAMLMILGSLDSGNPILESTCLRFMGRLSYALYLWTTIMVDVDGQMFGGYQAVLRESLGFIIAFISTIFLEEPLRRCYRRWLGG